MKLIEYGIYAKTENYKVEGIVDIVSDENERQLQILICESNF